MSEIKRTNDEFTTGLVNLPLLFDDNGKPVFHYDEKTKKLKHSVVENMRYPFFELDTQSKSVFNKVQNRYLEFEIPFYYHKTMRGYHFFGLVQMQKEKYAEWIKPLMVLNRKCPMVTLRIKSNKWENENKEFKSGGIVYPLNMSKIAPEVIKVKQLKAMIEQQQLGLLRQYYYLVHYRMTGELGNL